MDISEVARRSGMAASALRFYEERGQRRQYADEVLDQLALIALGRSAGLALDEIGRMFAAGGPPKVDRNVLAARADDLEKQIRQLSAMRDGLRHAAECRVEDHLECPKFRRLMGLAVLRQAGRGESRTKRGKRVPRGGGRSRVSGGRRD